MVLVPRVFAQPDAVHAHGMWAIEGRANTSTDADESQFVRLYLFPSFPYSSVLLVLTFVHRVV
jgi:hypothetical protein